MSVCLCVCVCVCVCVRARARARARVCVCVCVWMGGGGTNLADHDVSRAIAAGEERQCGVGGRGPHLTTLLPGTRPHRVALQQAGTGLAHGVQH